jgi:protein TonB
MKRDAAATAHGGLIRRGVGRTGGIAVALVGHLAVLVALYYQQASEPIPGELPTAITVDIVSAPAPPAVAASQETATSDEDGREHDVASDQRPAVVKQQQAELSSQFSVTATTDPALMAKAAAKSSLSKTPEPQGSSAKRQRTPLAITPATNPVAATDRHDGDSTGTTGVSATDSKVQSAWKDRLLSHLDRYKRYPDAARAQHQEGTALLSFGMNREGRVLTYYLVRSSGCRELDDEVLAMIERASPLPPAPAGLNEQVVQLVVPVRFRM